MRVLNGRQSQWILLAQDDASCSQPFMRISLWFSSAFNSCPVNPRPTGQGAVTIKVEKCLGHYWGKKGVFGAVLGQKRTYKIR